VVFKSVDNREIFLSAVEDKDGSALTWLRSEMAKLTIYPLAVHLLKFSLLSILAAILLSVWLHVK
jgi:hypothetical protein